MIIYLITNKINNKMYVGLTTKTLEKRWKGHCMKSANKMMIDRSIHKNGRDNFIIEHIDSASTMEELNYKEKYWALKYNTFFPNGYNLKAGNGIGAMSENTKSKIGMSNKGKVRTEEWLKNSSEAHKGWIPSEETRQKWRDAFSGKRPSENTIQGAIEHNQKTFTLLNPDGEFVTFTNMKRFCMENDLSNSKLCLVASGKRKTHKGWTLPENIF
jgi:group I intron endonuclease